MKDAPIWAFLRDALAQGQRAALLLVVASKGSSPGRAKFKMVVAEDGQMRGSVGGGIMEHKFVEYVRDRMHQGLHFSELRHQVHSKDAPQDQSGMICSGEQTLHLRSFSQADLPQTEALLAAHAQGRQLQLSFKAETWRIEQLQSPEQVTHSFRDHPEGEWEYREITGWHEKAYVVGGGHVGAAMCQLLQWLDFYVVNIDDRRDLNTMVENTWAHEKHVIPYDQILPLVPPHPNSYVIIMSFGYRGDEMALRQLIGQEYRYLGMMGSQAKVKQMLDSLRADGIPEEWIARVQAPAGIPIASKTPMEIALSIAAQMVALRDRG